MSINIFQAIHRFAHKMLAKSIRGESWSRRPLHVRGESVIGLYQNEVIYSSVVDDAGTVWRYDGVCADERLSEILRLAGQHKTAAGVIYTRVDSHPLRAKIDTAKRSS